ncbi:SDR family NAD(P)-dependent oxidoreductase [Roseivirga sp. BDSF3-8]|uniref:SDR family NAD(P)-dependent oxidoreductase n=1 Tax=Roseivirga sp. BDSF3-8 TaxID=3241598 RepID=UPI00353246FB
MKIDNFHFCLERQCNEKSNTTAFVFLEDGENEKISITFDGLGAKAKIFSGYFRKNFIADDRVILLLPNDLTFIYAVMGALYAGVISIPLHPINNARTLSKCLHVVEDAGTTRILTNKKIHRAIMRKYGNELGHIDFIFIEDIGEENAAHHELVAYDPQKVAFLQYTSGSTSNPKGVRVTHRSLLANLQAIRDSFSITQDEVILSWLPFFHDMGIIAIVFQTIFNGNKCVLFPPMAFVQNPLRWVRAIDKYRATMSGAPNFAYALCAERIQARDEALDLSCWKQAFCGAEPVKVDTYQAFCQAFKDHGFQPGAFYPGYGMAEATLLISGGERGAVPRIIHADQELLKRNQVADVEGGVPVISCGVSVAGHEIRIINRDTLTECAENEIGEIWFRGPSMADGYWNRDSENTFNAGIKGEEQGFLRTGDLGFLNGGELFVTGRCKELIIINGLNYFPKDIEELVESRETRLRENCTAAFEITIDGEKQLAFMAEVRKEAIDTDFEELTVSLRTIISQEIGLNAGYIGILSTGHLPKTTSGKIQRNLYAQLIAQEDHDLKFLYEWKTSIQPADENITVADKATYHSFTGWLKARVAAVLRVPENQVKTDEVLNRYGMTSITAVGLSGEISEYLGRSVSPTLFYNHPTIDAIARYLLGYEEKAIEATTRMAIDKEDIAIVGIGLNFPASSTPKAFWEMLCKGESGIRPMPEARKALHDTCRNAGYLDRVDGFDAPFFNISAREAGQMDPQQRLLLQTAYHALEDARLSLGKVKDSRTGVFVGIGNNDYNRGFDKANLNAYTGTGSAFSIAANRLSYLFDLKGPSLSVDTACSSSLVAAHLGVNSLQNRESDMAMVAGVNLLLDNSLDTVFTEAGMLSPDHQCKTFDAEANGYVRGEGCGVVLLKRLSDAQRDGNHIYALIKGSAINQDGTTNGITAPNGLSQQAVIREAAARAGVDPGDLSYIETHGTGTSLGDPIEVNALSSLRKDSARPCHLGAVKANIGHLEFAAGVAGLIKTTLCLQHKKLPGNRNLHTLNPLMEIDSEKLLLNRETIDWKPAQGPRRAGVSSFGFGGTNAHIILEEAPAAKAMQEKEDDGKAVSLLTLSARSAGSLEAMKTAYATLLANENAPLAAICQAANLSRSQFTHRWAGSGYNAAELVEKLEAPATGNIAGESKTAFLYTGQGSQYLGMGQLLYQQYPVYQEVVDHCANYLQKEHAYNLIGILTTASDQEVNNTHHAQITLFVLEYALSRLLLSFGVRPHVLMGHSIGEYAAACIAGVFSLEDALNLVYHRGKFMDEAPGHGVMYSVAATLEEVKAELIGEPAISVAAHNGTRQVVLSGEQEALQKLAAKLETLGTKVTQLKVSHAFHSHLMEPAAERFHAVAQKLSYHKPLYPIVSTVTGRQVQDEMQSPGYWSRQIRESVNFVGGAETLREMGTNVFVEVGPKAVLLPMIARLFPDQPKEIIPCLRSIATEESDFTTAIGKLYETGQPINWEAYYGTTPSRHVSLPLYPFNESSYWLKKPGMAFSGDTEALLASLEAQGAFTPEEKALLPSLLKKIQALSGNQPAEDDSMLYTANWQPAPARELSTAAPPNEQWLVIGDAVDPALLLALFRRNERVDTISLNEFVAVDHDTTYQRWQQLLAQKVSGNIPLRFILTLSDEAVRERAEWHQAMFLSLSAMTRSLDENPQYKAVVVTKRAVMVEGTEVHQAYSQLWGATKALCLDYPQQFAGIIDYQQANKQVLPQLVEDICSPVKGEPFISFQGEQRHLYRIEKAHSLTEEPFKTNGAYLISGGLGSLGQHLAVWLSQAGASHIVLLTRRQDALIPQRLKNHLAAGATVQVATCDVRSEEDVRHLAQSLGEEGVTIRGIVHAAGVAAELTPPETSAEAIQNIVDTKVLGAQYLDRYFGEKAGLQLHFSSIAAIWGSARQMLYSAANQALDAFCHNLRLQGKKAIAINWGPWAGSQMVAGEFEEKMAKSGITPLQPEAALDRLGKIITADLPGAIVVEADWERFADVYASSRSFNLFNGVLQAPVTNKEGREEVKQGNALRKELAALNFEADRKAHLSTMLQEMVQTILGHRGGSLPPVQTGFFELGLDSLMSVELKNKLQNHTGLKLPNTLLFEQANITELAAYLASELSDAEETTTVLQAVPPQTQDNVTDTGEFDHLSEDELARLLADELSEN